MVFLTPPLCSQDSAPRVSFATTFVHSPCYSPFSSLLCSFLPSYFYFHPLLSALHFLFIQASIFIFFFISSSQHHDRQSHELFLVPSCRWRVIPHKSLFPALESSSKSPLYATQKKIEGVCLGRKEARKVANSGKNRQ